MVSQELGSLVEMGVLSYVTDSDWATPIDPALKDKPIRISGQLKLTFNPVCALYNAIYA